jgi:hypothetical protein
MQYNPNLFLPTNFRWQEDARNYAVWASCWEAPPSSITSCVPQVYINDVVDDSPREPGNTVGPNNDSIAAFKAALTAVPRGRRVVNNRYYWLDEAPSASSIKWTAYKNGTDGTTYQGERFLTPWQNNNVADGAANWTALLANLKADSETFEYLSSDQEDWRLMYTLDSSWARGSQYTASVQVPDARGTGAWITDSRFTTYTIPENQNKTVGSIALETYDYLLGSPSGITDPRQIYTLWTSIVSSSAFINGEVGGTPDRWKRIFAFDTGIYTLSTALLKRAMVDPMKADPYWSGVQALQYDMFGVLPEDASITCSPYGDFIVRPNIAHWNPTQIMYGMMDDFYYDRGYWSSPVGDQQYTLPNFRLNETGTAVPAVGTLESRKAHYMCVKDTANLHAMARGNTTGLRPCPWISVPQNTFGFGISRYDNDTRYWYEMVYHAILAGTEHFQMFNPLFSTVEHLTPFQNAMDEWRRMSGNSTATPITDRTDIKKAIERCLVSGATIDRGPLRGFSIWRITVPPSAGTTTLVPTSNSPIKETLVIPASSRGIWYVNQSTTYPDFTIG